MHPLFSLPLLHPFHPHIHLYHFSLPPSTSPTHYRDRSSSMDTVYQWRVSDSGGHGLKLSLVLVSPENQQATATQKDYWEALEVASVSIREEEEEDGGEEEEEG